MSKDEYIQTIIRDDSAETQAFSSLLKTEYMKTYYGIFDSWKNASTANKKVILINGDKFTSQKLILLKRSELGAVYLTFEVLDSYRIKEKLGAVIDQNESLLKGPMPVIFHIQIPHGSFHDAKDIAIVATALNSTKNKYFVISTTNPNAIEGIVTHTFYNEVALLNQQLHFHIVEPPSFEERLELLKSLLTSTSFDKTTSLEQLTLATDSRNLYDIYRIAKKVQALAGTDKVTLDHIKSSLAEIKDPEPFAVKFVKTDGSSSPKSGGSPSSPKPQDAGKKSLFYVNNANENSLTFKDVAGLESQKNALKQFSTYIENPEKFKKIGAKMPKGIIFYGPPGTGKTFLAKAFAGETNFNYISTSGSEFKKEFVGLGAASIRELFYKAKQNKPCIILIDELDVIASNRNEGKSGGDEYVNQLLVELDGFDNDDLEGVFVIATTNRLDSLDPAIIRPGRFDSHIYFGIPTDEERTIILQQMAQRYKIDQNIDMKDILRVTNGWTPAKIDNYFNIAAVNAATNGKSNITTEALEHAKFKILEEQKALQNKPQEIDTQFDVVLAEELNTTFKDIGGLKEAKEQLRDVAYFIQNNSAAREFGIKPPKGFMLHGPPGTGKTLLARALAGETNVSFISVASPQLQSGIPGRSAEKVKSLFQLARSVSPVIVFIDEFEAIAQHRTIGTSTNQEIVNQLLTELDGLREDQNNQLFVVAATNYISEIDAAVLRPGRFDRLIKVGYPDLEEREEIFNVLLDKLKIDQSVDVKLLAKDTVGWSPASMRLLINEAATIAFKANRTTLSANDLQTAKNKIQWQALGIEPKNVSNQEELKRAAFRESGKAIVSFLLPEAEMELEKIMLRSVGEKTGMALFKSPGEKTYSYKTLRAQIAVHLASRAAEEVLLGISEITTGIEEDLATSSSLAFNLVGRYGYSNEFGLISLDSTQLAYDQTAKTVVKNILEEEYQRAKKLIQENFPKLKMIVEKLLEDEVIEGRAIEQILKN